MIRNHAMFALMLAGSLTACAAAPWAPPPGQYSSYHDYVTTTLERWLVAHTDMPPSLQQRLAGCYADLAVDHVSSAQLKDLDSAAQGRRALSGEYVDQINRQIDAAIGEAKRGDFSALAPYCPADIPEFKKYIR